MFSHTASVMSSMLVILTYKIVTVHMANIKGPPRAEKSEVRHVVKLGDTVKIRCPIQVIYYTLI